MPKTYYVYILASPSRVLYIGLTSDLPGRLWEHREGTHPGFTTRHSVTQLVHVEEYADVREAIGREKQLKGWRREKKIALIEGDNPEWRDLSVEWDEDVLG